MQMKKILGILLAVCFLMSVTVAAVSAAPSPVNKQNGKFTPSKHVEKITYKLLKIPAHILKIPAHIEFKKVKKFIGFKHGKKVYKTITIKILVSAKKIRVPAKWITVLVYHKHPKVPVYNNNHKVPVYNNNHKAPVYNNNHKAPVYNNNHDNNNNNNHDDNNHDDNNHGNNDNSTHGNNDNSTPITRQ